jgi:hypothetical protein
LGIVAQVALLAVFVSSLYVGGGWGERMGGREMSFDLSDGAVIRRRQGSADVEIRFDEVTSIRRAGYWFVIKAAGPERKIIIQRA